MNFELTDDQAMIRDMTDRLAAEQHGFEARRAAIRSAEGLVAGFWRQLAALGLLGATLPEDMGGLAGGGVEAMLIHQALGKRLALSPYLPTTLAARLIAREGRPEQRELLPAILAGDHVLAMAICEGDALDLDTIQTTAVATPDGFRLHGGVKPLVFGAPWCDSLVVAARLEPSRAIAAFLVPHDALGLDLDAHMTIDGGRAAIVRIENVALSRAARIGTGADLRSALELLIDEGAAALCAEACGSIEALLDTTVTYAKTRRQFGQPIGQFQVLQHRMVDMLIAREQAASITHKAALALSGETIARQRAVSAAKAFVGRVGRNVAQAAVQIHGGIGTTDELDISHHFRCIEMLNLQFGSIDAHVRRYAALLDRAPLSLEA